MAVSVNNIAAAFCTVPVSSSSSSSSLNPKTLAVSVSPQPHISVSWNLHTSLPRSRRSSFINIYGGPGPAPLQAIPRFNCNRHQIREKPTRSMSISIGDKLPNAKVSYLDRKNRLRSVPISAIAKGKKIVVLGASVPFAPKCSQFIERAEETKSKNVDIVACVAMSDVFVMRAWGEHLRLSLGDKLMMLSDGHGELSRALGLSVDFSKSSDGASLGLGNRSRRYCLVALNGVLRSVRGGRF
ncbi:hypothetical protein NE237_029208 [Protea cynaroides]|uniref:glutaredoxin-dependent peroxiredoxin n=1 Tax=Protea cynaroides TaxID=273540 RepID=A0A9Q0GSQ1_9MAGN|nr:hypothetical protein NE237_029208 [Protea cynaroides]